MRGDCNFTLGSEAKPTEEGAFRQKLEAGRGRGRSVLEKDHSGQKEE